MNQLKIKLRLFPQKVTDKITYEVNKIIKQAKKGSNDYNVQRKKILDDLKLFYGDPNNYTDVELQEHKEFLYSQKKGLLERIDSEFWELYKSTILSLLTITFSMLFILNNLVVSTNVSEDVKEINILAQSGYAAILTLVGWIVIVTSIKSVMVFRGRKYRKYKIIEYELTIIDMLQEQHNEEIRQSVENYLALHRPNNNGTP